MRKKPFNSEGTRDCLKVNKIVREYKNHQIFSNRKFEKEFFKTSGN